MDGDAVHGEVTGGAGFTAAEQRLLVRTAAAAPSVHNSQPWSFRPRPDRVEVWVDESRALPRLDPRGRSRLISCGAAVLNLRLATEHLGREPLTALFPDGDGRHVADVVRGPAREPGRDGEALYAAVVDRRTNRGAYRRENVPRAAVYRLRRAALAEGAVLHEIRTGRQREALLAALRHSVDTQLADPLLQEEFAAWTRPDGGSDGPWGDGVPQRAWERAACPTVAGAVSRPDDGGRALADVVEHGSLFLLTTATDDRVAWLRAGMAVQRVLLTAHLVGLAVGFLNQPVDAPALRPLLPSALDAPGAAQVLLRVGYPWTLPPRTQRRPLHEVTGG